MPQTKNQKRLNAIKLKLSAIEVQELVIKSLNEFNPSNKLERLSICARKIMAHQRDIENTKINMGTEEYLVELL
jgi:hypothetical protein